jgi:hypothetical protein
LTTELASNSPSVKKRLPVLGNVLLAGLKQIRHARLRQPQRVSQKTAFHTRFAVCRFVKQKLTRLGGNIAHGRDLSEKWGVAYSLAVSLNGGFKSEVQHPGFQ